MFALVESAFRVIDLGNVSKIIERRRSLPDHHDGLPDRLKKDIRESFHILDTDRDGLVSRGQVEYLVYRVDPDMSHEEMEDLLDTADIDGDQMYDMDEYVFLMYLKWNDQESVTDIKEAFKVFDKDSSGALSRDEFAFILRKLGEPLTNPEVDEILNHFDRDGSGEIDFDEFAYVMTGPHLDEIEGSGAGIPLSSASRSIDEMSPLRRILATPVSRAPSFGQKPKPVRPPMRREDSEDRAPLAGVYGRQITNSDSQGRGTIKFTKAGGLDLVKPPALRKKSNIRSAAELRPLGNSARPLTGGRLVVKERPKPNTNNNNKVNATDSVIERYHDFYGQPASVHKQKSVDAVSKCSQESDNFSMCSDVIRDMNSHGDHYVPEDSDYRDKYV